MLVYVIFGTSGLKIPVISDILGAMAKIVAVIGGKEADHLALKAAHETGRLLGKLEITVLTGGGGGVMEAASRGAAEAGGLTLGILPGDDTSSANPHVLVPVATGFGIGRNIIIARTADAVIAVDGQYGTLSEIAYALQLGKPVIGIGTWDIDGGEASSDPERAVEAVLRALGI